MGEKFTATKRDRQGALLRFVKGVAIGIGAILPGLSGGVLAVIFGIYDPMMAFLANVKKDFKRRALWFLPVLIGLGVGILLFSFFVMRAFGRYEALFTSLFIGFVAGTLPALFARAGEEGRGPRAWIALFISGIGIYLLMSAVSGGSAMEVSPNLGVWVLCGAIVSLGMIVPGLSPSNFLMFFGLYAPLATGIAHLRLGVILPFLLGLVAVVLLLAKPAKKLLERQHEVMYHLIFGLVVGSSAAVIRTVVVPSFRTASLEKMGLGFTTALLGASGLFILGIILSYLFSRLEDRVA